VEQPASRNWNRNSSDVAAVARNSFIESCFLFFFTSVLFVSLCLEFLLFQFYEGCYTHEMAHNLGFTAGGWDVVTLRLQGGSWVTRGYSFRELVSWMGM
jgi:hypothetical protein